MSSAPIRHERKIEYQKLQRSQFQERFSDETRQNSNDMVVNTVSIPSELFVGTKKHTKINSNDNSNSNNSNHNELDQCW